MSRFDLPKQKVNSSRFNVGTQQTQQPNLIKMGELGTPMDIFTGADYTTGGLVRNTVLGLPKATVDVAKNIGQRIARTVGMVGTTAGNIPTQIVNKVGGYNEPLPFDQEIPTKGNKITEALFGGEPIKTAQKTTADVKEFIKPYVGEKAASYSAFPLVALGTVLDLSGFGGGKVSTLKGAVPEAFLKFLAKETDETVIKNTLKSIGLDELNSAAITPGLAKAKNIDEVKTILTNYKPTTANPVEETKALLSRIENEHPDLRERNIANSMRYELENTNPIDQASKAESMKNSVQKQLNELPAPKQAIPPTSKSGEQGVLFNELPQTGDKNSPLSRFTEKEPESFREEIRAMLNQAKEVELPGAKATTKEVPPEAIIPKEVMEKKVVEPKVEPQAQTLQQKILEARDAQAALERSNVTAPIPTEFPAEAAEVRDVFKQNNLLPNIPKYEDIGTTKKQFRDIYRNTRDVFGKDYPIIDQTIIEPFNQAKGRYIDFLNTELQALDKNIPFDVGSKESKFIQKFGEKQVSFDDLVKEFGTEKANKIVEADTWFRTKYDEMLARLNEVEQQIYPNSPYKWTPKRGDYYRHFFDVSNEFSRLQNILENPIKIDPLLVGISEQTAPKSRWASFKQRRFGTASTEDAVGGYLDYLKSVSYAINIDPHIGKFRELADVLARGSSETKNLNNYIYNVKKFADSLAGKTTDIDRIVQETIPGGRTILQALNWLNQRVKANTILYNISSSLSQIYNVPQGIATAGLINSLKGFTKTLAQNFIENKEMAKSTFLKERFFKGFEKFDKKILDNPRKFGMWMVTVLDEAGTKFIWNAQYEKAIAEGIKNPIKFADDQTRMLVAGRGIGEKPLIQNSQAFQLVAPFQLELTNLWWVMEDMAKSDKKIMEKFGQFATLFVTLWLLNNQTKKMTGNRIALDPVQATIDGIKYFQQEEDKKKGVYKATGRLFGEVLGNIPLGQSIATLYPEYGANVFGAELPTRKEFFGDEDPTRFGGGLLATKALTDPLFKVLPPYGGGQLKETIQGLSTVAKGKSETKSGNFQYRVPQTPMNYVRGALFGKYGLKESQQFYNKETKKKTNRFDL